MFSDSIDFFGNGFYRVTRGVSGAHIYFANDYEVSVQWGPGTYTDNRHMPSRPTPEGGWKSDTAEIAVFNPYGYMISCGGDDVRGWQSKAQVRALLHWAAAIPAGRIVDEVPEFEE